MRTVSGQSILNIFFDDDEFVFVLWVLLFGGEESQNARMIDIWLCDILIWTF